MSKELDSAIDDAAQHIRNSKAAVSMPQGLAKLDVAAAGKKDFCSLWKGFIRDALEILKKFLPAWAAALAEILIRIGDKACPK